MSARSAREFMQRARGTATVECSVCGERYAKQPDGTPISHPRGGPYCPGSRKLPPPVRPEFCGCQWRVNPAVTLGCRRPPAHDGPHIDRATGRHWTIFRSLYRRAAA